MTEENKDHLDREVSAAVEITESGGKLATNSRFVAACDRLGGSIVDAITATFDGFAKKRRAQDAAEVSLIEAAGQYVIDRTRADPDFAARAMNNFVRKALRQQENKDAVLIEAKRDLEDQPPTSNIDEELSEEFLDEFEEHAAKANTKDLREIFGRLLAGEVRKPGTVSRATMHFVSVLEKDTAELIQRVLPYCINDLCYLDAMPTELKHKELVDLEQAGFFKAGNSQTLKFDANNNRYFLYGFERLIIVIGKKEITSSVAVISNPAKGLIGSLDFITDWDALARLFIARGADSMVVHFGKDQAGALVKRCAYGRDVDGGNFIVKMPLLNDGTPDLGGVELITLKSEKG